MTTETVDVTRQHDLRSRVRTALATGDAAEGWRRVHGPQLGSFRPPAGDPVAESSFLGRAVRCQRRLYDAGLAGLTWPTEYGGQGLDAAAQIVFDEESEDFELPLSPYTITLGMCGPTVLAVGTAEQKRRYVERMLTGQDIWCQLFSEPVAGSDVAGLRTRATRSGEGWVLDGHKTWTSGAQYSRYGLLLARTAPELPKHRGLTMFVLDLRAPGVTVLPVRQMNGAAGFNEVFLEGVELGPDAVLGAVDDGWRVSLVTLMNERVAVGAGRPGGEIPSVGALVALARARGRAADPVIRDAIADQYVRECALVLLSRRINAAIVQGDVPGPEGSVVKLVTSDVSRRAASLGLGIAGPSGQAWDPADPTSGYWSMSALTVPGLSIAGGTDEIMRNVIGERVLRLPKEPPAG